AYHCIRILQFSALLFCKNKSLFVDACIIWQILNILFISIKEIEAADRSYGKALSRAPKSKLVSTLVFY
ncbi:hypothetical protein, partial [Aeribacillus pallidus]|uniref:hypothetical protein n=1 Tax=Aeribacillus pallidus TaxID=33936 RepID=UPI001A91E02B